METVLIEIPDAETLAAFLQDHYGRSYLSETYLDPTAGYVRWLLSVATVWGMCLHRNLVAAVAVHRYHTQSGEEIGYLGIWCVNEVGRNRGLGKQLLAHLNQEMPQVKLVIPYLPPIAAPHNIPMISLTIRIDVLSAMGLVDDRTTSILIGDSLGLRITRETDLPCIIERLNSDPKNTSWSPQWTADLATRYLLPANHAVYSHVRRDSEGNVTDFIHGTAIRATDPILGQSLFLVMLGRHFTSQISLDELILSWVPHLAIHGVHQIIFPDIPYYGEIALPQQCVIQQIGISVQSGHPIPYPDVAIMPWI